MRRLIGLSAAVLIALGMHVTSLSPVAGEACSEAMPSRVNRVVGFTFVGLLSSQEEPPGDLARRTFDVERVFAGGDTVYRDGTHIAPGDPVTFAGRCAPMQHLREGHRYLISTADLATLSTMQSVAWEIMPDGDLMLVREYRSRDLAAAFETPRTVAEAVALVAPDSLPPTDTGATPKTMSEPVWLVLLLAGLLGAAAWWIRPRRLLLSSLSEEDRP